MAPKILVVDRNAAFASMLEQMLETDGGYEVQVVRTGSDALALLRRTNFDLTIIDMDLDPADMGYRDLSLTIRQLQPAMRLMLIPLMGKDLPREAHQLGLQGVLSKPFFVDDLLPNIANSLARQVSPPDPHLATLPSTAPPASRVTPDLQPVLSELVRETNADAALLLSTKEGHAQLVDHVSTLNASALQTLADLSFATARAAQAISQFLSQSDHPFEHNMFESESLRLYIMALPQDMMLVVVSPLSIPLGTIRHNLRRSMRALSRAGRL
jgi:CheY-like chemotaxis protein/predicted regulator of Ras-like GTPase activity (Roadblock/LC7/MglB family)